MTTLQWNLIVAMAKVLLALSKYGAVDYKRVSELENVMTELSI